MLTKSLITALALAALLVPVASAGYTISSKSQEAGIMITDRSGVVIAS